MACVTLCDAFNIITDYATMIVKSRDDGGGGFVCHNYLARTCFLSEDHNYRKSLSSFDTGGCESWLLLLKRIPGSIKSITRIPEKNDGFACGNLIGSMLE